MSIDDGVKDCDLRDHHLCTGILRAIQREWCEFRHQLWTLERCRKRVLVEMLSVWDISTFWTST